MKNPLRSLPILSCLVASQLFAADGPKVKILDKFDNIDPKTVKMDELKVKIVTTPDPVHHKALEMVADFAKPNTWPKLVKSVLPGTINPKKYSGIRFWGRSDSETKVAVSLAGVFIKDGKRMDYMATVKGTSTWTEYSLPFSEFKTYEYKVWKDGAQQIFKGGEPIPDADYPQLNAVRFVFDILNRGTATAGHFMIAGLELVEN